MTGLEILGGLLLVALIGGGVAHVAHVYGLAKAAGLVQPAPKGSSRGVRLRAGARGVAPTGRLILAQAWADNWVAKRAHVRKQRADGKLPPRRPLLARLVTLGGKPVPQVPAAHVGPAGNVTPLRKAAGGATPQRPAPGPQQRPAPPPQPQAARPAPVPANGRTPPMTGPGPGAASDMFAAVAALVGHAKAGGIRSKARTGKVFIEGFEQQAAALEEYARHLQDTGRYMPMVWEPYLKAGALLRAAAMAVAEADSALASMMATPMGEAGTSGIRAPHHDELNTA